MYVCVCKAVTDKTIRAHVAEGMTSMREMKQCLGVGSQCGKCVPNCPGRAAKKSAATTFCLTYSLSGDYAKTGCLSRFF